MRKLQSKICAAIGLVAFATASQAEQREAAIQTPVPPEVQALVPSGMKLLFFTTNQGGAEGSDAVAILESTRMPANAHISTGPRPLIVLRKSEGVYREVARNDKIIGCSTCGEDADDPFLPQGIQLTPGHLVIDQEHGPGPSTAVYDFVRDSKTQQWIVTKAVNTHVEQSPVGTNLIQTPTALVLPKPPLLVNFDPGWHETQLWAAIAVNGKTGRFAFLGEFPDQHSLDNNIKDECQQRGVCTVLVKQDFGCMALAKDAKGRFFAGSSLVAGVGEQESKENALKECRSHDGGACEIVRRDCSTASH